MPFVVIQGAGTSKIPARKIGISFAGYSGTNRSDMRIYLKILRKYKWGLILCPILVLITVVCETVQPYLMSIIVDNGIAEQDLTTISRIGIYMVIASIIGLGFSILNVYLASRVSVRFGTDLRSSLFEKIESFSFPDIDRFGSSSLITRLTNDITKIQQVILMSMRVMLRAPLMMIMALFFVITINPRLATILAVSIPALAIGFFVVFRKGFPYFLKVQQRIDDLNAVVRENLINIRVVKSFVREDFQTRKFTLSSEQLRDTVIKASNIIVTVFPLMQFVLNLSIIAVLWYGGRMVESGGLQVGELISFVNYLMQVLMALMLISMVIMTFARASASHQRIAEVLNVSPSLSDTAEGLSGNHTITRGSVDFNDVCFRYDDGENFAIKGISFSVAAGENIAVVGATGSAKTTMVQLIPRLYDVTEGTVSIDGVDVRDYSLDELRSKVGMVLQKNELFTGTILENLRWGNENASMEEATEAAKAAQAHDFITSFDDGYDTLLGRSGVNVSGGQKQRICIARALLRRPKILILDDSTSAVDTETERKMREGMDRFLAGTTVFNITQRVHTMEAADRILLLDDGRIEAFGTPAELASTSPMYREIVESQQIE